jgi:hypothetical protein
MDSSVEETADTKVAMMAVRFAKIRNCGNLRTVANESCVNTNQASNDTHDVLSECSGFAGTNDRGVCHRLTRTENTDKEFFSGHSFHGESEHKSHRKQEAFRNGDDYL